MYFQYVQRAKFTSMCLSLVRVLCVLNWIRLCNVHTCCGRNPSVLLFVL
jgi:hypothetical protein